MAYMHNLYCIFADAIEDLVWVFADKQHADTLLVCFRRAEWLFRQEIDGSAQSRHHLASAVGRPLGQIFENCLAVGYRAT